MSSFVKYYSVEIPFAVADTAREQKTALTSAPLTVSEKVGFAMSFQYMCVLTDQYGKQVKTNAAHIDELTNLEEEEILGTPVDRLHGLSASCYQSQHIQQKVKMNPELTIHIQCLSKTFYSSVTAFARDRVDPVN